METVKKQKTLSVLTSLENINEAMNNSDTDKATKRYLISKDVQDTFYAIHHAETPEKSTNRGRKRFGAQDQTALPKRKKYKQQSKTKTSPLYKLCHQLWPPKSMKNDDLSYDYIKSMVNLLKVRLTQARFRMMTQVQLDNDLLSLSDTKTRYPIHIHQQNKSSNAVIGNSKNLFNRIYKLQKRFSLPAVEEENPPPTIPKAQKLSKKKLPQESKLKRFTIPKRRSIAADIPPVKLPDGTRVFVCKPCEKQYKNRNGLAYHMGRCKNKDKVDRKPDKESISCVCLQTNDENMAMVQCEKCQNWSHSDCVHASEDDTFCCSRCESLEAKLVERLLETSPLSNESTYEASPKETETPNEKVNTPFINERANESALTPPTETRNSSQLHVWDDFDLLEKWHQDEDTSTWNVGDLNVLPPSLLFSDTTVNTTLEEQEPTPTNNITSKTITPTETPQDVWFQFANFEDDYLCE